jgi:large subunit ribosomal protein L23
VNPHEVLIRPQVTEKSTLLQEKGKYIFHVSPRANKAQVKEAVEKAFKVKVMDVNVVNLPGKRKRYGPRLVQQRGVRKAVVTLKPGDKIQFFEGL